MTPKKNLLLNIITLIVVVTTVSAHSTSYFYAGNNILATKDSQGDITYKHQDRLGTNTETKTLPFGQTIQQTERFGFTGKEQDTSKLHYFIARYYDSNLGRFTSTDPITTEPRYQYVANNPLRYTDPKGMNKQNINQEQPTFATAPPASTNNIQAQTQPPIRTWDIYENNPQEKLIGYYGWFLKMGEESKRFMEDMHARTLDLYETEGIRGLSRYISDFTWNQMEYSYDRWDEKTGRPTNKYNSIYKDGYPEAIDVLCQGQSVCLEKAYFTAEFINTHPTASQEWVAVPLLVTVTTHYTNNAIHLSPHKFVGLYDKASYINPEVSTPSYFVDYGQVAPADFVLDNHHPLKDGTGYVEYSNPRFSLTEPGSTPYFENK